MGAPPQILLGNLGMADSLILMVLALVVFGPRRLPQIGRQIGKLMYEFRKASNDFKFQMEEELRLSEDADRRKREEAERARNLALNPPVETVEAQASIGAVEQASVSAQPPTHGGELAYSDTESTPAEPEHRIYPRINPPSSGEPIPAARPGSAPNVETQTEPGSAADSATEPSVSAESDIGAEPAPTAEPAPPAPEPPAASTESSSEPTRTEPVSQHG
jgi:sec-independent protein translocase protein TatB